MAKTYYSFELKRVPLSPKTLIEYVDEYIITRSTSEIPGGVYTDIYTFLGGCMK